MGGGCWGGRGGIEGGWVFGAVLLGRMACSGQEGAVNASSREVIRSCGRGSLFRWILYSRGWKHYQADTLYGRKDVLSGG